MLPGPLGLVALPSSITENSVYHTLGSESFPFSVDINRGCFVQQIFKLQPGEVPFHRASYRVSCFSLPGFIPYLPPLCISRAISRACCQKVLVT